MDVRYWTNNRDDNPVKEAINDLENPKAVNKVIKIIDLLEDMGVKKLRHTPYMKELKGEPVDELRISFSDINFRIFFDKVKGDYWLFHAFNKDTEKTPINELNKAKSRRNRLLRKINNK